MTTNNKILTVSYGTFSCTLEGFEDNFGTMKVIAEYFRDLAGDDRYFGAEPPQPDVEMLTRIAEREISRRVEARHQDGGFVLSAEQSRATLDEITHTPNATVKTDDAEAVPQPETPDVNWQSELSPRNESTSPQDTAPQNTEEASENGKTDMGSVATEEEPQSETVQSEESIEISDSVKNPEVEREFSTSDAAQFFAQPDIDDKTTNSVGIDEPADLMDTTASNSIAAKLQRIRAVVTKSQETLEEHNTFEDEYFEEFVVEPSATVPAPKPIKAETEQKNATVDTETSVFEEATYAVEALQKAKESVIEEYENDVENDDLAAIMAQFEADEVTDGDEIQHDVSLLNTPVETPPKHASKNDDDENLFADSTTVDQDQVVAKTVNYEEPVDAGDMSKVEFPRARIIKVKRTDIDAAIASGALEEVDDNNQDDSETPLSNERASEVDDSQEKPLNDDHEERQIAEDDAHLRPEVEDDVSRLMAKADTHMEEPEGTSRRSAFAHLKAAVMAKKADYELGNENEDKDGAYRSDLASVVKPRRPETGTAAVRSESKRPAPLKLVAEQRVDVGKPPAGPVRPRRVAAREELASPETGTSFEEYASERGAHDLPELLEAAASYLSFIEGREQFSRPQLMTKVRQIEKDDFSREDGLRSFGQLLRAGKIEKIKGGRFAVTGDIGYQPDQRAAG